MLTVNVYDTIANKTVDIFDNIPSDYYTGVWSNNTRGNIVVTAYRTVASENWGFKWYRYDARGRVIKMWHQIDGMGTKVTEYDYNSSNQMIYTKYQPDGGDYKLTPENGLQYYIKLSEAKSRPVGNHLGSIRVIIDIDRQVLSANDYSLSRLVGNA